MKTYFHVFFYYLPGNKAIQHVPFLSYVQGCGSGSYGGLDPDPEFVFSPDPKISNAFVDCTINILYTGLRIRILWCCGSGSGICFSSAPDCYKGEILYQKIVKTSVVLAIR